MSATPVPPPVARAADVTVRDYQPAGEADLSLEAIKQASWQAMEALGSELTQLAHDTSLRRQVAILLSRFFLLLRRDPALCLAMLGQPIALAVLVALSQFRPSADAAIGFFLTVLAVWFGMNNSVRELVRQRKTYVREQLAGLSPIAFYLAHALGHAAIGAIQVIVLLLTTGVVGALVFAEDTLQRLSIIERFPYLFLVLLLCHCGGVGIGLLISAAVRGEDAAVAALPLVIMPQLVLSALATGQVDVAHSSPRPFRPLVNAFTSDCGSVAGKLVDLLSLGCLSRPGTLLIECPMGWRWMGDLCHLIILLFAFWTAAYFVFLRQQRIWPKYIGLG